MMTKLRHRPQLDPRLDDVVDVLEAPVLCRDGVPMLAGFQLPHQSRVIYWCPQCPPPRWHLMSGTQSRLHGGHCQFPRRWEEFWIEVVGLYPDAVPHGTEARYMLLRQMTYEYVSGCRCEPCRKARSRAMQLRRASGRQPWPGEWDEAATDEEREAARHRRLDRQEHQRWAAMIRNNVPLDE